MPRVCHKCNGAATHESRLTRRPLCLRCWEAEAGEPKAWYSEILAKHAANNGNPFFPGLYYVMTKGSAVLYPARPEGGEWKVGRICEAFHSGLSCVSVQCLSNSRDIAEIQAIYTATLSAAWEPARDWTPPAEIPEGWIECPHCNGHGSSMYDPEGVNTCFACDGVGLLRPRTNPAPAPVMVR